MNVRSFNRGALRERASAFLPKGWGDFLLQLFLFTLVDIGSTNGVRLNNAPVARHQLAPGDRIELGSTTLVFQRDGD